MGGKLEDSFSGFGNNTSKGAWSTRIVAFYPLSRIILAVF
jgi:hypothetical protein